MNPDFGNAEFMNGVKQGGQWKMRRTMELLGKVVDNEGNYPEVGIKCSPGVKWACLGLCLCVHLNFIGPTSVQAELSVYLFIVSTPCYGSDVHFCTPWT